MAKCKPMKMNYFGAVENVIEFTNKKLTFLSFPTFINNIAAGYKRIRCWVSFPCFFFPRCTDLI